MVAAAIEYLVEVKKYIRSPEEGRRAWTNRCLKDPRTLLDSVVTRPAYVSRYSWAVPSEEALSVLARLSPIVEIGAGNGYWAHLLQSRGADVRPYDRHPPNLHVNHYHAEDRVWTRVFVGGPEKVFRHPDRTLFLCWPPLHSSMAERALRKYQGSHVAYIGEWRGCTASEEFHTLLSEEWVLQKAVPLPSWPSIHDRLTIWTRKRSRKRKSPTS